MSKINGELENLENMRASFLTENWLSKQHILKALKERGYKEESDALEMEFSHMREKWLDEIGSREEDVVTNEQDGDEYVLVNNDGEIIRIELPIELQSYS